MTLSAIEAAKLDKSETVRQDVALGTELRTSQTAITAIETKQAFQAVVYSAEIVADATSGLAITIPYDMNLIDVIVQCTATSGSGTVTVKEGANSITDAIVAAVDGTNNHAGTIDKAYNNILTTDTITAVTNGANDRAIVSLVGYLI